MYCPNCGNNTSADQKFCRSCGLGLQKIAQSLSEQIPTRLHKSLQQRKEKFEKLGVVALSIFGAGVLIPILYSVFYKMMWTQGKVLAGLGLVALILVLACGLLSTILFAKANELKETAANPNLNGPPEMKPTENTKELLNEGAPQPAFSVAERTTELLLEEKRR